LKKKLILVGVSTGGPSQIKKILSQIKSLSSTIIIVQHMKEEVLPFFIKDLKNSINSNILSTPTQISFNNPSIIICSHSSKVEKKGSNFEILTDNSEQRYTPDIDKLFNSFVKYSNEFDIEVLIMTGIGSDGVEGAKNLKNQGAVVIAQDEKSSPVFGMPRVAIESGIVDEVKSIDEIIEYFKGL